MKNRLHSSVKNLALICAWFFASCQLTSSPTPGIDATATAILPSEVEVEEIPLTGPASSRPAELSGMAWYGDTLILLPQYPDRFDDTVFSLSKTDVLNYLDGVSLSPLEPVPIAFDDGGLNKEIHGYEGFESIAFSGDQVYLTIEARPNEMRGYIVSGSIQPDLSEIRLNPATLTEIPLEAALNNISDESLLVYKDKIITLFEANGKKVNPSPVAHLFNQALQSLGTLPFPHIEYRITDAAPPDQDGFFWAINYYFPPDEMKLKPQDDILAERYELGETHRQNLTVERLVQFHISSEEIQLVDIPPVQLHLEGDIAPRNWEALSLLDDKGFLIATDKFPRTILGFVPYKVKN